MVVHMTNRGSGVAAALGSEFTAHQPRLVSSLQDFLTKEVQVDDRLVTMQVCSAAAGLPLCL